MQTVQETIEARVTQNKLASREATLVQSYNPVTKWVKVLKGRATGAVKKLFASVLDSVKWNTLHNNI